MDDVKVHFGDKLANGGSIFFGVNFEPQKELIINKLGQKINQTMFGWGL